LQNVQLFLRELLPLALLSASVAFPQSKQQVMQMQRDLALLQVEVRELKSQQGERMAVLEELIKQNLETTGKLNQAIAVIERSVTQQAESVVKPVTSISSRVDALSGQVGGLRDAVEALNTRLSRMQQQLEDVQNHLTTLPPPSGETGGAGGNASVSSAQTLYNSALSDFHRGNYDLAQQQFQEYLQLYPQGGQAAEAQYYAGDIAYQQKNFDSAIKNYDMVLERYPEGSKSPDAQYKKGLALMMLNKLPEAAAEFRSVLEKYPNSNVAPNAQAKLEGLQGADSGKPSPTRRSAR
jgi:tol-pal system protein YbgF